MIHVTPNEVEKQMCFNFNNMLIFIDNFQFISSSVDSLVKNLDKDDFKYFSQESDSKILGLVNQKRFYPHKYISDFEDIKMNWQIKKMLVVR